jgi:hypothetical protein
MGKTASKEVTRPYISAVYLLAEPPPQVTIIPKGMKIKRCPAKHAKGTQRAETTPSSYATKPTAKAYTRNVNEGLRAYAAQRLPKVSRKK